MSSDQVSNTKKKSGVATSKPSPKRARKLRSDDGANILPNAENFVSLVRKVTHPGLLVDLIERTSATALPELKRMVEVANGGKLPIESRKAFFHAVGELEETTLNRIECAAERVMLLDDDYGAQAVLSLLNEDRADDAAVLAAPSDRYSRALYLHLLQDFPEQGARRDERFDQAEHLQVMHRQWKSDHYSSHYLGPKGIVPKTGPDVQEILRVRIAELFPKVLKDQILIEQFTRRNLSCEQDDDCEVCQSEQLHTLTATFNGKTATFQQVTNGHVVDHEEPAAMSARFSWEPETGSLSVFCEEREARRELATVFRDVALAHDGQIEDMPMRQFDLLGFATSDMLNCLKCNRVAGVDDISILQITVAKPYEQTTEYGGRDVVRQLSNKMQITRDRRDTRNIYQIACEDFGDKDLSQYALVQVKLVMKMSKTQHRKAHNVAVQITAPNGLNDKSRTDEDRKRVQEQLIKIGVLSQF
ncbi:MAG: hypothetical protein KA086_01600 [Brachymonas sp.]|jgi:hypothetical protein|nr:hypothetical protein [Brachymonas sp.]